MELVIGLDLLTLALLYGYCLTAQPRYATAGTRRVAAWTERQPFFTRCVVAFAAWVVFMTGLVLVIQNTR